MTDYSGIIERLKKATGPDRSIDFKIGQLLHNSDNYRIADDGSIEAYDDGHANEYGINGWFPLGQEVSHYTASIDAAMTLVPEGWGRSISGPGYDAKKNARTEYVSIVREYQDDINARRDAEGVGRHTVLAIAVCIAAIRARSALAGEGERDG